MGQRAWAWFKLRKIPKMRFWCVDERHGAGRLTGPLSPAQISAIRMKRYSREKQEVQCPK
jgi:hypothetical protein